MSNLNWQFIFCDFYATRNLQLDLAPIVAFCYEKKAQTDGRILSNRGGWQSDDIYVSDRIAALAPLTSIIQMELVEIQNRMEIENDLRIDNMWININGHRDWNTSHRHPHSLISGVFYVRIPEGDNGRLVFENVNPHMEYYITRKIRVRNYNDVTASWWNIAPSENQLVFFPAWLSHTVEPNYTHEDRISIAFNISAEQ